MPRKRRDSRSDDSSSSSSDSDSSDSSGSEKSNHRRSRKDDGSKLSMSRDVKHGDSRQHKESSRGPRQLSSSRQHSWDSSRRRSPPTDSRRGDEKSHVWARSGQKDRQYQSSGNRRHRDTDLRKVEDNKNRMDHRQRSHDREPEKGKKGKDLSRSTSYSREKNTRDQAVKDSDNYVRQQSDASRKDYKNLDADTRRGRNDARDSKVNPAQSASRDSLKERDNLRTDIPKADDRVPREDKNRIPRDDKNRIPRDDKNRIPRDDKNRIPRDDKKQSPESKKIKLGEEYHDRKKMNASAPSYISSEDDNSSESDSDVERRRRVSKDRQLSKEAIISRQGKSEGGNNLDGSRKSEDVKAAGLANKKSETDKVGRKHGNSCSESDSDSSGTSGNEKFQVMSKPKRSHSESEENTRVEVQTGVTKTVTSEKQLGCPQEKVIFNESRDDGGSEEEKEEGELSEDNEDKLPDKPLKAISDYVSDISSDDGQPDIAEVTETPQPPTPHVKATPTSHVKATPVASHVPTDIAKESGRNVEHSNKSSKVDKTDKRVLAKKKEVTELKSGSSEARKSSNFSDHEVVEGEDNSMRQRPVLESDSDDDTVDKDAGKNAARSNIQSKQKIGSSVLIVRQEQGRQDRGRDESRGRGREDSRRKDKRDARSKPETTDKEKKDGNSQAKRLSDESEHRDKSNTKVVKPGNITATKPPEEPVKKPLLAFDITSRAGGAYIPPAKLRMMQERITDKTSAAYQRMSWEALKKSINGIVNKINVSNATIIVKELFQENIVRGRGLLARSVIQAQAASPTFTHVYAALVAIINTKFPQNGELILRRLILMFRRGFKRNDKALCLSTTTFIAHLVNQQVAHEVLALEILTLLLENPTDDSVEIAVGFLKECGLKLSEISPRGMNSIFEQLRNVLHEGLLDVRVQYMVEVMFAVRKDGFKDHPSVLSDLDLVEEDDQFTHLIQLEDAVAGDEMLNVFKEDPAFAENEEKYKTLKKEILDEGSSDEDAEDSSGSGSSESDSDDEEKKNAEKQIIIDRTETNLVALRRIIYLTIQSSLDHNECAHKMLKMELKPGQEVELCNMILDCCAQLRTYEKFYGLLAQRFCQIDRKYIEPFQQIFLDQYETIHRLETNKLRNVAKFFSHMLYTDAISWGVLSVIKLTEDDTTSASRIFLKTLFQELSEYMGLLKLNERLKDPTLSPYFSGIMARDNPKNTRFCINFFTTIGLGGLTDDLREHLKTTTKQIAQQNLEADQAGKGDISSSSESSSDSSDSDSSSESQSDTSSKRKNRISTSKTKKKTEKDHSKSKKKTTDKENQKTTRHARRSSVRDSHSKSRSKSSGKAAAVSVNEKHVSSDKKTIAARLLDMAQYGNVSNGDLRATQSDRGKGIRPQLSSRNDKESTSVQEEQQFDKNRKSGERWAHSDRRFYGDNRENRKQADNIGYRSRDTGDDGRAGGNSFRRRDDDPASWDRRPENARRWRNNFAREDNRQDVDRGRHVHTADTRKQRRQDSSSEDSESSPEHGRKRPGRQRSLSATPEKRHRKQSSKIDVAPAERSKKRSHKESSSASDSSVDGRSKSPKTKRDTRDRQTSKSRPNASHKNKRRKSLSSSGSLASSTSSASSSSSDNDDRRIVSKKSKLSADKSLRRQEVFDKRSSENNRAKKNH